MTLLFFQVPGPDREVEALGGRAILLPAGSRTFSFSERGVMCSKTLGFLNPPWRLRRGFQGHPYLGACDEMSS